MYIDAWWIHAFLYRDAARLLSCCILYELEFVKSVSCFYANREGTWCVSFVAIDNNLQFVVFYLYEIPAPFKLLVWSSFLEFSFFLHASNPKTIVVFAGKQAVSSFGFHFQFTVLQARRNRAPLHRGGKSIRVGQFAACFQPSGEISEYHRYPGQRPTGISFYSILLFSASGRHSDYFRFG